MDTTTITIILFVVLLLWVLTFFYIMTLGPWKFPETTRDCVRIAEDMEKKRREEDKERLSVEHLLLAEWFALKKEDGVFSFPPVNLRSEENPFQVDAIKYDASERSEDSLAVLTSVASDDKLLVRHVGEGDGAFQSIVAFKTCELQKLQQTLETQRYVTNT